MDTETCKEIGKIIGEILGYFLGALILMLLWNWLVPVVFGLITLTYWQAFVMLILSRVLFYGRHSTNVKVDVNKEIKDILNEKTL